MLASRAGRGFPCRIDLSVDSKSAGGSLSVAVGSKAAPAAAWSGSLVLAPLRAAALPG